MRGFYLLLFLALVVNVTALAQSDGDFRSATSGPWNQASTWETFSSGSWIAAGAPPNAASGVTTITAFTTVDVVTSVTGDEIVVEGDAVLNIQSGGNLTVAAGGLVVTEGDGFFTTDGFLNILTGGTVTGQGPITSSLTNIQADGTYIHATNGGNIPFGSWNDGSVVSITGITNTAPGGLSGQSFYDLTWNCNQSGQILLAGALTDVRHNLSILNTGSAAGAVLSLTSSATGSYNPLVIGNDLTIAGNAALAFGPNTGGVGYQVTVGGNVSVTSSKTVGFNVAGANSQVGITVQGNFTKNGTTNVSLVNTAASSNSGSATLEVNGNFVWAGGTMTMAAGSNASNFCVGQLNIGGDLTINAGTFTETSNSSNGRGEIIFDDAHTHALTSPLATPFANSINFSIPSSNRVNIASTTSFSGIGGMLLSAGATLGIASPNGISLGTSLGNIRVSSTGRSYAVNSNIVYNGTGSQNLGDEWGGSGKLNGVAVNLEIANSSGVINNITPSTNLVGNLTLTSGAFDIGTGNTLTVQANFTATGGTITGHSDSNLTFGGSGSITGNLNFTPGSAILNSFTINRSATVFLGSDLTLNQTGALNFQSSGNLRLNGNVLTINGDITQTGSGAIASNNTGSSLVIGGSGALTTFPLCTSCGFTNEFNNITLNRSGGASYTWNSAANVNGTISLAAGSFTHSSGLIMATNSTFSRSAGTTYSGAAPNATSTYNVSYIGNLTSSAELPTVASNALNDLIVAGNVTLDKNIKINGNVSITSGTLDATTHNVNMAGATFAVNGGSFTINAANTVTFSRAGTTTLSGSTINNSTFGNLTINSGATVVGPNANINITGVWLNNGTFNPQTGTVTFNGTTQNINANGQPFYNLITANGTKTLTGNLDVNGTLTIGSGSTLAGSSFTIFIADTWDNQGTFTAGTSTVNFDGAAQTIDGTNTTFNNVVFSNSGTKSLATGLTTSGALTINSGVTLDVTGLDYPVTVGGAWSNNGSFNARNGTVTFSGSVTQTVGGSANTQFYDIVQTNASTLTMSSTQSLVNSLTISAGTFNPNGNFVMLSSAAGDARINQLGVGASIANSNATIQRYLWNTANVRAQRYLSSPVSNAFLSGWKDNFPITGSYSDHSTNAQWAGQGLATFNETSPSVYVYQETKGGAINTRWTAYAPQPTLTATPLVAGVGYGVQMRHAVPITIDIVGRPNFGPVSVNVTAQGVTSDDGWNLVGNPYPSPISWSQVSRPAGLSAQIALLDNTNNIGLGAGQYVYYTAGGTGIPASYTGTIAQGQAFYVRMTTAGSATLTFQEDDKLAVSNPPFMRQSFENTLRVHVAGNNRQDELVVAFNDNAQDEAGDDYDAFKLVNTTATFYSKTGDAKLAINTFNSLACSREVSLGLDGVTAGAHTIQFSQVESFPSAVDIRLLDNFAGKTFVVTPANTTYNFDVTSDANSFGANRFKLYVGYKELDLGLNVEASAICDNGDAEVTILQPQQGVTYMATLDGTVVGEKVVALTDSDVKLTIPANQLPGSKNTLVIKAQNGTCSELPLTKSAVVERSEQAKIFVDNTTLNSNSSSGNQWYFNGVIIEGATGKTYTPTESGTYKLTVTSGSCVTQAEQNYVVTGDVDGGNNAGNGNLKGYVLYPNPTSATIYVEVATTNEVAVRVLNSTGVEVTKGALKMEGEKRKGEFNISGHAAGVYLVVIKHGDQTVTRKIIKN